MNIIFLITGAFVTIINMILFENKESFLYAFPLWTIVFILFAREK